MNNFEPISRDGNLAAAGPEIAIPRGMPARELGDRPVPLLTQYLSIARRRKWLIVGFVVVALLIGLLVTMLSTPRYTASASLEIKREEASNFINVEGAQQKANSFDTEFYQTQYGLLRATSLAERVATNLRLFDNPAFFEMFGLRDAGKWFAGGRVVPGASTREERIRQAGAILLRNAVISPERLSRLVEIRFTSPDPALSQRIVDAWTANFIEATLERRFEATSYARRFLDERLGQLRARLDESERALFAYASRENIVNLPTVGAPTGGTATAVGEHPIVADNLADLNRELTEAIGDRVRAQSRLGAAGGAVTEALQNPAISTLRERRAELAAEYARLMAQFEPEYPPARAAHLQIEQLDRSIAREEARVRSTIRETYEASLQREEALRQRVAGLRTDFLDFRRRSIQYNILQREVDTNRQLYDALLQRYKEIGIAGGVGVNNISVVDRAELPQRPSSPNLPFNMALALLAGLIAGALAAFVREQMDQGIIDPSEVENDLRVPLLGTIPRVSGEEPLDALQDRKSALSEAYLSLQTNLSFSTDHGVPRTLAVTSTRPAEGKTTTSYALARLIARANRRVVLVDSDMRSPSVHRTLKIENKKGLSNYLAGGETLANLIVETPHEGLFTMTAGPQPPSAPELLSGERFDLLIAELLKNFDHVIFDSPPVMGLADAPLIASRVEGTVIIVESNNTHKSMVQVALGRLKAANAQIIGVVLTKFDSKRAHYGYGYDYGYGYGYGGSEAKTA